MYIPEQGSLTRVFAKIARRVVLRVFSSDDWIPGPGSGGRDRRRSRGAGRTADTAAEGWGRNLPAADAAAAAAVPAATATAPTAATAGAAGELCRVHHVVLQPCGGRGFRGTYVYTDEALNM